MTSYKSSDFNIDWSACTHIGDRPIAFTTAPDAYDWGWTRTEADNVAVLGGKDVVRVVSSRDTYYQDNQLSRYASGLYWAITPDQLSKYLEGGELVWTPDQEVRHLRAQLEAHFVPPGTDWTYLLARVFDLLSKSVDCRYEWLTGDRFRIFLHSRERVDQIQDQVSNLDAAAFLVKAALAAINQEVHDVHWSGA